MAGAPSTHENVRFSARAGTPTAIVKANDGYYYFLPVIVPAGTVRVWDLRQ